MLRTLIKKNFYQDSVTLMILTNKIGKRKAINKVSIMMATPANKNIMAATGFETDELVGAGANDIAIVLDIDDDTITNSVLAEIDQFFNEQANQTHNLESNACDNWNQALEYPNTNIVMLSIAGEYVYPEAEKALDCGKHVFIFSDNVSIEDELKLKTKAEEKGLLVMGPDCGTAIIGGVPLAFANEIPKGSIAIVGASGTGIQEISSLIANKGSGVYCAIGTGGRDLSEEINGLTMKNALYALADDVNVKCIVVVSKPPAASVKESILEILRSIAKPVVTIFLGEEGEVFEDGLYSANTLEEAAEIAVVLDKGEEPALNYTPSLVDTKTKMKDKKIKGYYAGGTLAKEGAFLLGKALNVNQQYKKFERGTMFDYDGHTIIDLGDDFYTKGKPHPMIDPENRIKLIEAVLDDKDTGIVIFDIVLGHGAHDNMAAVLAPVIKRVKEEGKKNNREIAFIGVITGTILDYQDMKEQQKILEAAGAIVAFSNATGVMTAINMIEKEVVFQEKRRIAGGGKLDELPQSSVEIKNIIKLGPNPINIGLKSFIKPFEQKNYSYVQFNWKPIAGGNITLQKMLAFLDNYVKDTSGGYE